MLASHLLDEWQETDHPSIDGRMVNRHATFLHHFLDVPVDQRVRNLPSNADQDDYHREAYGLNHCIELDVIATHAPLRIQWTSCAGTLHLFEEMFVPTLRTVQRTSHLYCSGLRCQHHRSRETTGTQRTWTSRQGPERRKCLTGRSHASSFPQGDNPSATRH